MWVSFNTDFGRKEKSFLCFFTRKRSKKKRKSFSYLFVLKLHIPVSWNRNIFITGREEENTYFMMMSYRFIHHRVEILKFYQAWQMFDYLPNYRLLRTMRGWHGMRLEHLLIFTVM